MVLHVQRPQSISRGTQRCLSDSYLVVVGHRVAGHSPRQQQRLDFVPRQPPLPPPSSASWTRNDRRDDLPVDYALDGGPREEQGYGGERGEEGAYDANLVDANYARWGYYEELSEEVDETTPYMLSTYDDDDEHCHDDDYLPEDQTPHMFSTCDDDNYYPYEDETPGALSSCERETPHLLMGTPEFDGDGEREKDYCKVRFAEGVVTDLWEISRRRVDVPWKQMQKEVGMMGQKIR